MNNMEQDEVMRGVFVHPKALCESTKVGLATRIWAFAHVLPGATIGVDCNICDHVFVENDVFIGDGTTIKCGVQIWDGLRIGRGVFIGPNATFTNDRFPRSKLRPGVFAKTTIEDGASIGANATILPGVHIGRSAMVGAGAVVTRDVPANATVVGNPAVIIGYQGSSAFGEKMGLADATSPPANLGQEVGNRYHLGVGDCWLERLPYFEDMRGSITPLELERGLPFLPNRVFLVYNVPSNHVRGEHAHHACKQFLVAASGRISVVVDDGKMRREVQLDDQTIGLYLAPKVWGIQYKFEPTSVLMVAASLPYDPQDYIRDYTEFLKLTA